MIEFISKWGGKTVGKGEDPDDQHYLLYSRSFHETSLSWSSKMGSAGIYINDKFVRVFTTLWWAAFEITAGKETLASRVG